MPSRKIQPNTKPVTIISNIRPDVDVDAVKGKQNGKKEKEITIKDGKPDGLWTWWHENGQKKAEANYKDGKPADGLYTCLLYTSDAADE